jgi:hypothetical protein
MNCLLESPLLRCSSRPLIIKYLVGKAKQHLPSGGRLNQKSSASQRQINCAAKSFAARRGILLRDPNQKTGLQSLSLFFVPAINLWHSLHCSQ